MTSTERTRLMRAKRKAASLCLICGKVPVKRIQSCVLCRELDNEQRRKRVYGVCQRESMRRYRAKRRSAGLCVDCGQATGNYRCRACALVLAERQRQLRARA